MPERNRSENILSQEEAKMYHRLARILPPPILGQPMASLLTTIPLTSVFSNEPANSWKDYIQNNLRDVIQLDDSDFVPRGTIAWPAGSIPIFQWSEPTAENPRSEPIFNCGGPYTRGRTVWSKRNNDRNTNWLRRAYRNVPEAEIFFDAMTKSSTQEEMNSILNANFHRMQSTPFDDRVRNLYSTSIDVVMTLDSGWDTPLEHTGSHGNIVPIWGSEYDGLTGAGMVEGELRFTEAYVGELLRDDSGNIDAERVSYRMQKIDDKIRVYRDLGLPMVVLPHPALTVIGTGPNAYMMSDIAFSHCHAVSMMLRHPRYNDETWDHYNRAMDLATRSFQPGGPNYTLASLRMQSSVTIEEIRINLDTFLESLDLEDYNAPISLLHGEYVRDRFNTHGYNQYTIANDMGLDPHSLPGLRMTAEHSTLGVAFVDVPTPIGYGCSMHHEYDYVMMAGVAAAILHHRFSLMQNHMFGNSEE